MPTSSSIFQGKGPRPIRAAGGHDRQRRGVHGCASGDRPGQGGAQPPRSTTCAVEGWDRGVPPPPNLGRNPSITTKGLPLEKALASRYDARLGARTASYSNTYTARQCACSSLDGPGTWSVKWVQRIEVTAEPPDCWYHWQFYYYGNAPDDPNKELITTIGVRSIVTFPRDDQTTFQRGTHIIRGRAWSGAGAITQVEVSVDGGQTWRAAHLEPPRERWLWGRWSYVWDAQPGAVSCHVAQPQMRWVVSNPRRRDTIHMRKNFSAIVATDVTVI